ncbi:MAG TPA: BamA/TamA family outer membrane protein [Longimicrobiales bacterium]|nr:BamA/TamA family outer membrane protein [Longimicrobiales bacterium]
MTLALVVVSGTAAPVSAQSCAEGVISEITYERQDPFGAEATSEESRLGWIFRGLNVVHVTTLPKVVRWELLFDEGDCLNRLALEESARALRSLPYIVEAEIESERLADGSHRVRVQTTDAWTLSVGISFTVDDGFAVTGLSVNERNLLGTGTQIGWFRNVWRERRRVGLLGRQPNLFGSRIDGTIHGGATRSGDYISESLFRPYAGELGKNAFRQVYGRRDDYFAYSVDPAAGFTQAYLRFEADGWEATYQRRIGDPQGFRVLGGLGVSWERIRFPNGAEGVRIVSDNQFDETAPAPEEVVEAVSIHANDHEATRLNFTLGIRNVSFLNLIGLDAVRASQDVQSGVGFRLSVSPGIGKGSTVVDDVLLRGEGDLGLAIGDVYLRFDADAQARSVQSAPQGRQTGWRDVLYELNANAYWDHSDRGRLFIRAQLAGASRVDLPFQLTLGGREAVRGYDEDAYPGRQRLLVTVEERWDMPSLSTSFADIGLVAFADAGQIWAGDVPFGETPGWRSGVGAGLRIGFPAGAPNVIRIDVGTPLTGDRETRGTVFRVYGELLGLLDRRAWPTQVERSRWFGVDPDLVTRPLNPLAGN